jgi:hypothetical protein
MEYGSHRLMARSQFFSATTRLAYSLPSPLGPSPFS